MLIKQSQETNQEIQKIELQKQDIQKKIEETKEKTKEIDETLLDNLTKEKKQISETLEKKNQIVDYNLINKVVQQNIFDINTENTEITTLDETRKYLEECIRKGKSLNEKITFNQQSKEQIKKQEEYRNKSHEKELENITTNYERLKKDVEEAEERLLQFSKQIQEEKNFSCDKIQGTCPYITIINKQHFESREEEQKKYQEEVTKKKQILEDFNYEQKIKEKKEEKSDENFKEKLENIEKEIQQDSTTCERMKKFFETIQYPTIKKEIEEEKRLINILQEKDKQFNELFEKKQNIEKYQKEIVTLENNIKNLDEQKEIQKKKNAELTDKIQ